MRTCQIPALTKERQDGTLYTRRPDVEKDLGALLNLPKTEILNALKVRDVDSQFYLKSECIVHLIRATRSDNDQQYFGELYRELMRRIAFVLPHTSGEHIRKVENVYAADARDYVRDRFIAKLTEDRQEPSSDLDYFEVMFTDAVAALRRTSMRKARKQAARIESLEVDDETNEPSLAVERAIGSLDVKQELLSEDPIYRSRVAAAIDALPDKQRRVLEMILLDMPIDSSDPEVLTIRKVLGVRSEKTVRNRRDAAYLSIRNALGIGAGDE